MTIVPVKGSYEGVLCLVDEKHDLTICKNGRGTDPMQAGKRSQAHLPAHVSCKIERHQPKVRKECINILSVRERSWRCTIIQGMAMRGVGGANAPSPIAPSLFGGSGK